MHEMYLEVHEQSVFDEISAGGTSKPIVTYETYRTVLTHITTYHLDVLDQILVQYVMN